MNVLTLYDRTTNQVALKGKVNEMDQCFVSNSCKKEEKNSILLRVLIKEIVL